MSIGLQLLLSQYEKAKATGDTARATAIFQQMEKVGLPDRLRPRPSQRVTKDTRKSQQTGVRIDPGRF